MAATITQYYNTYGLLRHKILSYYDLIGCQPDSNVKTLKSRIGVLGWIINISNGSEDTVLIEQWTDYNKIKKVLMTDRERYNRYHYMAIRTKTLWIVKYSNVNCLIFEYE